MCEEASVSIKCFDWSKMAAKAFPVASCEPAIHVLRSGVSASNDSPATNHLTAPIIADSQTVNTKLDQMTSELYYY